MEHIWLRRIRSKEDIENEIYHIIDIDIPVSDLK